MRAVDPVTVAVVRHRFDVISEEMQVALVRSAYSPSVKEGADCSAGLFTAEGEMIAQATAIPVHLGSLGPAVGAILRRFPVDVMRDGDVYLMNDPYDGGQHLPDIVVVIPILHADKVVALGATMAHHQEMGGSAPGSNPMDTTEIYQEGLRLPPVKLYDEGVLDESIQRIIEVNVRIPDVVIGDINAQVAAGQVAKQRMLELLEERGLGVVESCIEILFDQAEQLTRRKIEEVPDGTYTFCDYLDNDGIVLDQLVRICVSITKQGSDLKVDFQGTSQQVKGPFNAVPSVALSAVRYVVRAVTDARIPNNSGCYRMIELTLPEGSIVNPRLPAAVNSRATTLRRIVDSLFGALAQAIPDRVPAASNGHPLSQRIGGINPTTGRMLIFPEISTGGMGARPTKDGIDAIQTDASNAQNVPIEALELSGPVRVHHYRLRTDSGGPGKFRGGLGLDKMYEILEGEFTVSHRGERYYTQPWGLRGGGPAASAAGSVYRENGEVYDIPSKGMFVLKAGDRVHLLTTGGGGHGDALDRPMDRVLRDVIDLKVSPERAACDYGVVVKKVDGTYRLDSTATESLRRELRAERGPVTWLYDRGERLGRS